MGGHFPSELGTFALDTRILRISFHILSYPLISKCAYDTARYGQDIKYPKRDTYPGRDMAGRFSRARRCPGPGEGLAGGQGSQHREKRRKHFAQVYPQKGHEDSGYARDARGWRPAWSTRALRRRRPLSPPASSRCSARAAGEACRPRLRLPAGLLAKGLGREGYPGPCQTPA